MKLKMINIYFTTSLNAINCKNTVLATCNNIRSPYSTTPQCASCNCSTNTSFHSQIPAFYCFIKWATISNFTVSRMCNNSSNRLFMSFKCICNCLTVDIYQFYGVIVGTWQKFCTIFSKTKRSDHFVVSFKSA